MTAYAKLQNRTILKLKGQNALGFLNKLITNNAAINKLIYACMLNSKGRFLCDFFVLAKNQDELLIDIANAFVKSFTSKIKLYNIDEDIKIETLSDLLCIVSASRINDDFLPDPRLANLGFRAYLSSKSLSDINNLKDDFNYDLHRLQCMVPEGDTDLEPEKSIILEYGFDNLNAISFTKGCYPGQELMARTKHRGQVRKSLVLLKQKQGQKQLQNASMPVIKLFCEVTYEQLVEDFEVIKLANSSSEVKFNIQDCSFTLLSQSQDLRLCLAKHPVMPNS